MALTVVATASFAGPPAYGDGTAMQDKIRYCSMLVKRFGHESQSINSDYYGIGVKRPNPDRWEMRVKGPRWFSDSLYIVFEQTTNERYEDYEHLAYCHWSQDAPWFEFVIGHFDTQGVALCYAYADIPEHICP